MEPTSSCRHFRPSRPSGRNAKASLLKIAKGLVVELGDDLKLDEVDPALAGLNLSDEAGWSSESLGDLSLG